MSAAIHQKLTTVFAEQFGDSKQMRVARAPGRVNLLGEHTDYNDGFVLPMSIDRAVWLALRPRADDQVKLYSLNFKDSIAYSLAQRPEFPKESWASYVSGVVEELHLMSLIKQGFEGVVYGDVPLGAGLSSSAALEVATVVALQHLFGFELEPAAAAELCQRVEHRYVGVQCGIMDQFASRLGRAHHALFLDCRSLDYQSIPLHLAQADLAVVIIHSGVKRQLADSKYNERRAECEAGVKYFQQFDPEIIALRDISLELFEREQAGLDSIIAQRCRHVIQENQRVLDARQPLAQNDFATFGQLMNASHASLRDDYAVSGKELDALVSIAQQTKGVVGARMTGAGFGGCTVQIVAKDAIDTLQQRIEQDYARQFSLQPSIWMLQHNISAGPWPVL